MTTVTVVLLFKDLFDGLVEKAVMHYEVLAWNCLSSEFSLLCYEF